MDRRLGVISTGPRFGGPDAYDHIGRGYAEERHSYPRIMSRIVHALGATSAVLNVGSGPGSYEESVAQESREYGGLTWATGGGHSSE